MLTALGTTNEKVEGFDAGADDYMVKPFEMKELLARIKALYKRSQYAPHENILKVEDLEVNLKTKQVMRAGNTIDLTPKEFNLLTYMLNNKGRVLSKSEIAEKVWDTKFDTGTNFIDVYISYLRRKIDKDYSKKLIQTKNGMGYILISHENPD
jgi:Response regulators consisting of a CheY-like receiver domain and a winged-helix DNA-binding domain